MTIISICELSGETDSSYEALVQFDHSSEYPASITNPFSEDEEEHLRWYFEQYPHNPFHHSSVANETVTSIVHYGESLFTQVFANTEAYQHFQEAIQSVGITNLQIEIIGSVAFHQLHWETMKDPVSPEPLSFHAPIVRRSVCPRPLHTSMFPSPTTNVLLVVARPFGDAYGAWRTVSHPVVDTLQHAGLPVQIDILRPATYQSFIQHLEEIYETQGVGHYHVIHFDLYGVLLTHYQLIAGQDDGYYVIQNHSITDSPTPYEGQKSFLLLDGEQDGQANLIDIEELAEIVNAHQIPIVILTTCPAPGIAYTQEAGLALSLLDHGVQIVLITQYPLKSNALHFFSQTLYNQLLTGQSLSAAVRRVRIELANHKVRKSFFEQTIELEDWMLPVVYQNQERRLLMRELTPDEHITYKEESPDMFALPETSYGIVGHDIDVLRVEKRIIRRNILLIRGVGGIGKTTFLQDLAVWWQKTGFIEQVFYFSYDEQAWTIEQIVQSIAQQLFTKAQYYERVFQDLNAEAQHSILIRRLRTQRHVIILDNLESVTGAYLSIQNILPIRDQMALRQFLTELVPGKTIMLLGSRGKADWLTSSSPLAAGFSTLDIYDLPGLDPEAVSRLTNRILQTQGIPHDYSQKSFWDDLHSLLDVLDGSPLSIQVVLSHLATTTLDDMLDVLQINRNKLSSTQTRNLLLDEEHGLTAHEDKKRILLHAIEYLHSNISPDMRTIIYCFKPFTSVINQSILDSYTEHLKQQPQLAHIPFHRWREVIQVISLKGLLNPIPTVGNMMQLQPIFAYMLHIHTLSDDIEAAIKNAFCQLYNEWSKEVSVLLGSNQASEKKQGIEIARLEYENLFTALNLALKLQVSFWEPYHALFLYLDSIQDYHRGLELSETVLEQVQTYPQSTLHGEIGAELVGVLDDIAMRQFLLSHFDLARDYYQQELRLIEQLHKVNQEEYQRLTALVYRSLGEIDQAERQWGSAESYYLHALKMFIELNNRYEQASTYHKLGMIAQQQEQWNHAESHYQQAYKIFVEFEDRHSQAWTLHQLGTVKQAQRQWAKAEAFYQQELRILVEFHDSYEQANSYLKLGMVAQEQRQWVQARTYFEQALEIFTEFEDQQNEAKIYHQLGIFSHAQRQWAKAKNYYQQALKIFKDLNNRYEQASTFSQLGLLAQAQRQWTQAKDYYQQVLQIFIEFGDVYNQAITYRQLGQVAQAQRQWIQAESYYQQALKMFTDIQNKSEEAAMYVQLGVLARAQRQWEPAASFYGQALEIFIEINDLYEQANTYHKLCIVTQAQQQWDEAESYAQKALDIYIDVHDRHLQANIYGQLGILARVRRQWQKARDHFLSAIGIYVANGDNHSTGIILSDLAWLWRESGDEHIVPKLAELFDVSVEEMHTRLEKVA